MYVVESLNDTFGNLSGDQPCELNGLLDEIIDNNKSDSEEEDDQSPELWAELESRTEALIEEFLELAFAEKYERTEQLKSSLSSKGLTKEDQ